MNYRLQLAEQKLPRRGHSLYGLFIRYTSTEVKSTPPDGDSHTLSTQYTDLLTSDIELSVIMEIGECKILEPYNLRGD